MNPASYNRGPGAAFDDIYANRQMTCEPAFLHFPGNLAAGAAAASSSSSSSSSSYSVGAADGRGFGLPLNLIALIVSFLDDLSDLANLTRTSRLLYYMALPQLYQSVTLKSYPEIRRVDGRVEGLGGGSPMSMALSGLCTSQCAAFVKHLKITGAWKESDDYSQGRIPDSTMLLSITVRTALSKMQNAVSFDWQIDTKPLRTVYQGLVSSASLTSFTLRFPTTRTPRPINLIPPIPNLKFFKVTDIDPLCYNDDISLLLLHSRKIEDLRISWSPRMRMDAEASSDLSSVFGRCIQHQYKLSSLKRIGLQNHYGPNHGQLRAVLDPKTIVSSHFLDVFGGVRGPKTNVFVDDTWRTVPLNANFIWKIHRSNELAMQHTRILKSFTGLEELYLVSKSLGATHTTKKSSPSSSPLTSHSAAASQEPTPGVLPGADLSNLGREYLHSITTSHGATLKNLLLFDSFAIDSQQHAEIVRLCPQLEQLGLALGGDPASLIDVLVAQLPRLRILRVLLNDWMQDVLIELNEHPRKWMELLAKIGRNSAKPGSERLEWIVLGSRVLRIGPLHSALVHDQEEEETAEDQEEEEGGPDRETEIRREVSEGSIGDVENFAIWSMDCLEI